MYYKVVIVLLIKNPTMYNTGSFCSKILGDIESYKCKMKLLDNVKSNIITAVLRNKYVPLSFKHSAAFLFMPSDWL